MNEGNLFALIPRESQDTILARTELLESLRDREYRRVFVAERLRSSVALQIRAIREAREMSQKALGEAIGMAQTWVSKLENPDYGKMTVATLLRLADAFDTDLEIKFRPFSTTLETLPKQKYHYFEVPSFSDQFETEELSAEEEKKVSDLQSANAPSSVLGGSALEKVNGSQSDFDGPMRMGIKSEGGLSRYATR